MSDFSKVVCGKCNRDPEIVTGASGEVEAVCPGCGQRDKLKDALRIGSEHFEHQAGATLQDLLRDATKDSEFMQFEATPLPQRSFRWHAV